MDERPVETTLYSLSGAPPAIPQRRGEERYLSLLRVGSLVIDDRRELCLIRNISSAGMMIRAYSEAAAGTRVSIELKQGDPVEGEILWAEDGLAGIKFDAPIDIFALLAPEGDAPPPRMPRIEVACTAWVRDGAFVRRTRAANVSQGGICVQCPIPLTPKGEVTVTLLGLSPIAGAVRWREGNRYGIAFNRVLPLAELVGWLQSQTAEPRKATG